MSPESKEQVELSVAIANRIYEILETKGMTQKDLAQRLGKTETEVSRWLSGTHNLTLSTICKISTALGEDIVTVPLHSDMQKQKKIFFLHGFYASGSCVPALALREAFDGRATVLTPDLPLHPADAIRLIRDICDKEKPDILVGNSCGSFYAQMIAPMIGVPALLGNPHFKMSDFLRVRIGNHQYKSPRADGKQDFTIDEQLVKEFEEMEKHQFLDEPSSKERVWGLFGEEDTLAHFEPLFLEHYTHSFHFPGGHTPTAEQFKTWYVPLIEKLLKNR